MQLLSRREVAQRLSVSERTLDRMTRLSTGPRATRLGTRRIMFLEGDLNLWLAALPTK